MFLNDAVSRFLAELEVAGTSRAHRQKTEWSLGRLTAVFGDVDLDRIDRLKLARFMRELHRQDGEPYSEATMAGVTQAVKALFAYCQAQGLLAENVADRLKRKKYRARQSRVVPPAHLQAVIDALPAYAGRRGGHAADVRDALVVSISVDSGARLGEICALRASQMERAIERPYQTRAGLVAYHVASRGKTGEVMLRFFAASADLCQRWLQLRPPTQSDRLFISLTDGRPLVKDTVSKAFDKLCKFAEVPIFRCHAVRHRNITDLMRAGADPKAAAAYANHSDESVTLAVYRHLIDGDVDDAAAALVARRRQTDFSQNMARLFGVEPE